MLIFYHFSRKKSTIYKVIALRATTAQGIPKRKEGCCQRGEHPRRICRGIRVAGDAGVFVCREDGIRARVARQTRRVDAAVMRRRVAQRLKPWRNAAAS